MTSQFRVAIIGGGVVGCSILYHLTKRGWRDVALFERTELTAGSTWHAAGGMHTLNGDPNVAALQKYTIELYKELETVDGVSCGVHRPGCLYLASTPQELEFFRSEHAKAKHLGLDLDFIALDEAKRLNPLLDTSHYIGAMFDPNDGYVDPTGVTNAMAKGARDAGAEVFRHCPVQSVHRRSSGEWELLTAKGAFIAEYVVNAGGLWAREVGRMFGVTLPIVPMEHQYIITNEIPELAALGREVPVGVDFQGGNYFRQERNSLLFGTYEQDCRHWSVDGTPADFGMELIASDLDRIMPELEKAMQRMPVLGEAGIKRVINGGMVFSPDGNPIIGPLTGQSTAFVAAGCMAGFSQSGGVGLAVSNWIVDGEPGMDVFAMDVARYGTYATNAYVLEKTAENYRRRFVIPCPNEELAATRPFQATPLYDRLVQSGALFGQHAGWEVPLWFAGTPADAHETPTFRRSNAFHPIGAECNAVRNAAGLWETSTYSKIEIEGAGAAGWLDGLLANRVPSVGRIALSPMLTPAGRVFGDVTVLHVESDRLLLMGSPAAEPTYIRWLTERQRAGISIRSVTNRYSGLALTGPNSRRILSLVTRTDVGGESLPFLHLKMLSIGCADTMVARISFTGELGFEIYMDPAHLRHVYEALHSAGHASGLKNFGVRALNCLRLEKAYGSWGREYTQDVTPAAAGLSRFVRTDKPAFVGREAVVAQAPPETRSLALLRIETSDLDPSGGEPVFIDGVSVARLTSAAHSYQFNCGLGLAFLPTQIRSAAVIEVGLLDRRHAAVLQSGAPYDPSGHRLRS